MAKSPSQVITRKKKLLYGIMITAAENVLAEKIKNTLIEKIESNFYNRYGVGDSEWLVKSITTDVKVVGNIIKIFVFFDNQNLAHNTWWGSEELGIQSGDKVYTPNWINSGWTFAKGDNHTRLMDLSGVNFMEDTIKELNVDRSWVDDFYVYVKRIAR